MNVVIHTPRVYVEEWRFPTLPQDATDAEILAIIRGQGPPGVVGRRATHATFDTGPAFVYSRGASDFAAIGRRLAAARDEADRVAAEARKAALDGLASGVSERQMAVELGVDRHTLRAWIGKTRGRK